MTTECQLKLYRPYDREPYGEAFDTLLEKLVVSAGGWRRGANGDTPTATFGDPPVGVELHEDGPLFRFFVENAADISTYLSALASLVSAWAAVRAERKKPRDPLSEPDGTVIQLGDLTIKAGRHLSVSEIESATRFLLSQVTQKQGLETGVMLRQPESESQREHDA